jgi:hypothetical protein
MNIDPGFSRFKSGVNRFLFVGMYLLGSQKESYGTAPAYIPEDGGTWEKAYCILRARVKDGAMLVEQCLFELARPFLHKSLGVGRDTTSRTSLTSGF